MVRGVGLFSGTGGLELGLQRAGINNELLCESWAPAVSTLRHHFDAPVVGDIRELQSLPQVDVITAGFPCTDLSQVGRTAGIGGHASGLVREVFRLIEQSPPTWVVLENVPNMLSLHGGAPMRAVTSWFDDHGWNWAYRIVDSQHFGVRQRRRRVFVVASRTEDPRRVLFADDAPPEAASRAHAAYGFSWTEGNRGLGWGPGVTPTLRGGSSVGIASPPGVWIKGQVPGLSIVRPTIEAGERLQGFRAGWTSRAGREGVRWKLVGNAVTVPVAAWIGRRLGEPGTPLQASRTYSASRRLRTAASCVGGLREDWSVSERPVVTRNVPSLSATLNQHGSRALSHGATSGFTSRLKRSTLRHDPEFMVALESHLAVTS